MLLNFNVEQKYLNHLPFRGTITKWNSLDLQIWNSSYTTFKNCFIDEFRPVPNSVFNSVLL